MHFMDSVPIDVVWGGKLPSYGDFLWSHQRGPVRNMLEEWLQTGMLQGRSQYGNAWDTQLSQGPIWNMLWPSKVSGADSLVVGCLAPSVDRVGRRYPFVVAYVFPAASVIASTAVLMELPVLMHKAGHQLHVTLQRGASRSMMDGLWEAVFNEWSAEFAHSPAGSPAVVHGLPSAAASTGILEVLGMAPEPETDAQATRPVVRGAFFPWPDMGNALQAQCCSSYWWTHPAGGAKLKAFCYESGLDGTLMTWLFGRRAL